MGGPESAAMRMGAQAFEVWLAALLQHFSLPPAPKPLPGVVTLHFGDIPSIHIMVIQALRERVDAVQKILGRPTRQTAQRGAGTLARMLAMR